MATKAGNIVNNKKYKLVPPDGGWGYMICVAAIINFASCTMFMPCFGMIYSDLFVEIGMDSTSTTLLQGLACMSVACSAYFAHDMLKLMSLRKCGFVAACIFNAGMFGTVFVNSKLMFFLCQGLCTGIGTGFIYNVTCATLNEYFYEKRLFAISLSQTIAAALGFVAPKIISISLEQFGFRGALMIFSGITLQMLVGVTLMQPVEWHMKRVEIEEEVDASEVKLLLGDEKSTTDATTPTVTVGDAEAPQDVKTFDNFENESEMDTEKRTIMQGIKDAVDWELLKKFLLSNASMGPTFCLFADSTFCLMMPQALYAAHWTQSDVATAISVAALGDLVTRFAFIFLSKWMKKLGSQEVYIISLIITVIARLGMLASESKISLFLFLGLLGVSRSGIMILIPLIIAEVFPPEMFTKANGLSFMLFGIMNLVFGPAVGAIRDVTQSYSTVYYILTSCFAVVVLLWSVELLYKKNKHRRKAQLVAAEELRRKKAMNKGK